MTHECFYVVLQFFYLFYLFIYIYIYIYKLATTHSNRLLSVHKACEKHSYGKRRIHPFVCCHIEKGRTIVGVLRGSYV
jgi:hypothetical protein